MTDDQNLPVEEKMTEKEILQALTDKRMVPVRSCESLSGTVNSRRL